MARLGGADLGRASSSSSPSPPHVFLTAGALSSSPNRCLSYPLLSTPPSRRADEFNGAARGNNDELSSNEPTSFSSPTAFPIEPCRLLQRRSRWAVRAPSTAQQAPFTHPQPPSLTEKICIHHLHSPSGTHLPSPLDGDSEIHKTVTTSCGWAEGLRRPPLGYCGGRVEATATSSSSYSSSTAVMLPTRPKCSTTMRMTPGHPPLLANEVGGVERRLAMRSLSSLL
uniref:Uncharacterized protein n=1 Tax=Oryza nivara TaxID=4536 RepID=A0A0E0GLX7_ORYNI